MPLNVNWKARGFSYMWAAEQGFADAQYNLSICYEEGLGVQQDSVQAEYWLTKSEAVK